MKNYLLKISILSIIAIAYITISLSIFPINNAYAKQYNSKFQTSNQTSILIIMRKNMIRKIFLIK